MNTSIIIHFEEQIIPHTEHTHTHTHTHARTHIYMYIYNLVGGGSDANAMAQEIYQNVASALLNSSSSG